MFKEIIGKLLRLHMKSKISQNIHYNIFMYIDYSDIVAPAISNVINIDQKLLMIFSNIHSYFSFTLEAIYGIINGIGND